MVDGIHKGIWLLIDAAGPVTVIGLVSEGNWLAMKVSEGDFLETLESGVGGLLHERDLILRDISGVIYGSGPGSTLGLRLAAIFIRTLLQLPELDHWCCYQYHNLALAICSHWQNESGSEEAAVAPWRRDRLHISQVDKETMRFRNDSISPAKAVSRRLAGISLGRRHPGSSIDLQWQAYPVEKIPMTLKHYPWLLEQTASPAPYMAEIPEFAQWNPTRHSAK